MSFEDVSSMPRFGQVPDAGASSAGTDDALKRAEAAVQEVLRVTKDLRRLIEKIGTLDDTRGLRENLQETRDAASAAVSNGRTAIASLPSSVQAQRVAQAFNDSLGDYETAVSASLEREKAVLRRATNEMPAVDPGAQAQFQAQQLRGFNMSDDARVDAEIIREQNLAVQQIEQDLADLAECFVDVAEAVGEQGEMLDNVQENVAATRVEVEDGVANQRKALEYKQGARWKLVLIVILCILLIGGIVAAAVCGSGLCAPQDDSSNSTDTSSDNSTTTT